MTALSRVAQCQQPASGIEVATASTTDSELTRLMRGPRKEAAATMSLRGCRQQVQGARAARTALATVLNGQLRPALQIRPVDLAAGPA